MNRNVFLVKGDLSPDGDGVFLWQLLTLCKHEEVVRH